MLTNMSQFLVNLDFCGPIGCWTPVHVRMVHFPRVFKLKIAPIGQDSTPYGLYKTSTVKDTSKVLLVGKKEEKLREDLL